MNSDYSIRVGNRELVLHADALLATQARSVLEKLKDILERSGTRAGVPTTVDFGWTRFIIIESGSKLVVHEPTFVGNVGDNVQGDVSRSLTIVARQVNVLRLLGVEGCDASFKETLVYVPGHIADKKVYMERAHDKDPGDSGWYVGPVDGKPSPREMVSRYTSELLHVRPALLDALLLPPGYLVVWDGDAIEAVVPDSGENVWTSLMTQTRRTWPTP